MSHRPAERRCTASSGKIGGVGIFLTLLAACGGGHHDVALPSSSAPGAPSVSGAPTSVNDAIKQSYTQYWVTLPQAEHADSEARRRQLLATYSTDPQLSTALRGIDDLHAKDLTSSGYVVVHIERVQVNGGMATVVDCQDATHALIQKRSNGKTLSRGVPNDHIQATLIRGSDGRWRISQFAKLSHC